jgi:membrane protease YdiL (CAAX protease family)
MQTYLKTKPVWMQLLIFIGMAFGIFISLSFAGAIVLSNITGIALTEMADVKQWDSQDPKMIYFIRGLLLIQFLGLFVIPSHLFAFLSDPHPLQYLGLKRPFSRRYWILGIVSLLLAIPLADYLGMLNQQMSLGDVQDWMKTREEDAASQIKFMLARHTPEQLILNLLFIAVFAGIGEELFFRGILQRLFIRAFRVPWAGIIFTAILFSAFHLQFFGFLPRLLLGILLGAVYWYSGSLWTAILAHFFYDALIIVILYFNPQMIEHPEKSIIDPSQIALMAIVSGILTLLVIRQMKKSSKASYQDTYRDEFSPPDRLSF